MNLNAFAVAALLAGIVLSYAAVKNKYPQDIIREAMGKTAIHGSISTPPGTTPGIGKVLPGLLPATGVPVVTV